MGTREPWGCGGGEGRGGDSELPQDWNSKGPNLTPDWRGAEWGGSLAGEALGRGARRSSGRGKGRRECGSARARARGGPRGSRRAGGARSSAGVAAEMRRPPVVRRDAVRGSRIREGEPGARTCVAEAGKHSEASATRGGARRGLVRLAVRPRRSWGREGAPGLGPR